jgi:hypothetical protein
MRQGCKRARRNPETTHAAYRLADRIKIRAPTVVGGAPYLYAAALLGWGKGHDLVPPQTGQRVGHRVPRSTYPFSVASGHSRPTAGRSSYSSARTPGGAFCVDHLSVSLSQA